MTNDEQDKMLIATHTNTIIIIEKQEAHDKRLTSMEATVYGNGKPGVKMDVDRLKQKDKLRAKIMWTLVTATVGLVARLVFVLITN